MSIQEVKDLATLRRAALAVQRADDYLRLRPGNHAAGIVRDLLDIIAELRELKSRSPEQEQLNDKPIHPDPPRAEGQKSGRGKTSSRRSGKDAP